MSDPHARNTVSAHAFGKDDADGFVRVPGNALREVLLTNGTTPMTRRPCPCCGDAATPMHFIHDVHLAPITGVTVINDYDVAQCTICGMCFATGIPDQRTLDGYYSQASKYTAVSPCDDVRHEKTADLLWHNINPAHTERILDLGSGAGGLTGTLARRGFTDVTSSNALSLVSPDHPFDGIILSGVLEHVVDVRELLVQIRQFLKKDGWIWVEVPNAALFHTESTGAPLQEFSSEHINFFTPPLLRMTLHNAGFAFTDFAVQPEAQTPTQRSPTLIMWARAVDPADRRRPLQMYLAAGTEDLKRYIAAAKALPSPCILWGAGTLTRRLWPHLEPKALYVTDSNPAYHGHTIGETMIISPSEALRLSAVANIPFIACTQGSVDSIQDAAATLGVTAQALLDFCPVELR